MLSSIDGAGKDEKGIANVWLLAELCGQETKVEKVRRPGELKDDEVLIS